MELTAGLVVLAAGAATRFHGDTHKLLALVDGEPIVRRTVRVALAADVGPVAVVTGAIPLDDVLTGLDAQVLHNDAWAHGLATSLRAGAAWAARTGVDAMVVGLGDQPGITSSAWRAVATAEPAAVLVVASYDGVRGHPVRIADALWPDLPANGDAGARSLLAEHGTAVVEVPCTGSPHDIDTLEDLQQWS